MNCTISFTQYFVNKQNIRSYSNIINQVLFKPEHENDFFGHVFQDDNLMKQVSRELKDILIQLKENVKHLSKQDFRNYFAHNNSKHLISIDKKYVLINCSNALKNIIPSEFFGSNHNYKVFVKITKCIIYSMKRQCFNYLELIKSWDFSKFPWVTITGEILSMSLMSILFWIYKYVLSAMLSLNFYITSCKKDNNENKLYFFWKTSWHSFYDKAVCKLILNNTIKRISSHINYCPSKTSKLKLTKKDAPKIQLVLKSKHNDFRPIVVYKKKINNTDKQKIKERLDFLKQLAGRPHSRIETQYSILQNNWMNRKNPKLYFIKTDLTNAFGSINKKTLLKILCEKHQDFQRQEKSLFIKKRFASLYRQFVNEIRRPLVVRTGSSFYEWNKGLVQGYTYSPALSELYYSYMDEIYFSNYLKNAHEKLKVFIRVVDDYLYITDSLEDAHAFLKALENYQNVNYEKTLINFSFEDIKQSSQITFLGYTYDTEKMHVCRAKNVFVGQMCYKIAFTTAISNIEKFIENRIGQSGIYISSHIFNFHYNNEALVWQHIFVTLCCSANKFCTILAILCQENDMLKYLSIYKKKVVVSLCNSIIYTLLTNKPKDYKFVYCVNHFRYLSYRALLLCAKQTSKCYRLISYIDIYTTKSNCIYGKWKEHFSRINKDGSCVKAVREECRRHDLRVIMKQFNELPEGFECFKRNTTI